MLLDFLFGTRSHVLRYSLPIPQALQGYAFKKEQFSFEFISSYQDARRPKQ